MPSTVQSAGRKVARLLWLLLWAVTNQYVKLVHLLARYAVGLRGYIRRWLAKPVQRLSSHALAKSRGLPPAKQAHITVTEVETETKDGVMLYGTLYLPIEPDHDSHDHSAKLESHHKFPTIIVRTPYGRFNLGPMWATVFAERGYACLLQDTRGRFGSSGDFFPVKHEIVDGGETIRWVKEQEWSNGKIALYGVSYLGLTTYAAAGSEAGHEVAAMMPVMSAARTYSLLYHSGSSLALDLVLRWLWLAIKLLNTVSIYKFWIPGFQGELNESFMSAPLSAQDELLIGQRLDFLQEAIRATSDKHEFWQDKNILCDMTSPRRPPTHIIGGWHDFFIKGSFQDFEDAKRGGVAGRPCKLTVGKWKHWEFQAYGAPSMKLALEFFDHHLRDDKHGLAAGLEEGQATSAAGNGEEEEEVSGFEEDGHAIHVAFLGTRPTRWIGLDEWPPRNSSLCAYTLAAALKGKPALAADVSGYRYDPARPTPYAGGPSFDPHNSGIVEQSSLESRDDVLVFSSAPLADTLYICGDVFVDLHFRSSNCNTDVFLKLCDVSPSGNSYNLVESLTRLGEEDWVEEGAVDEDGQTWYTMRRTIKVGPIAQCFKTGHAWRLQVSGGAHPLYMRNFGTGHEIADAVECRHADHRIMHDSRVLLPVMDKADVDAATVGHPAYPDHRPEHSHA